MINKTYAAIGRIVVTTLLVCYWVWVGIKVAATVGELGWLPGAFTSLFGFAMSLRVIVVGSWEEEEREKDE